MTRRLSTGMAELARSMQGDDKDDRPHDARHTRVGFSALTVLPPMRSEQEGDDRDSPRRGRVAATLMNAPTDEQSSDGSEGGGATGLRRPTLPMPPSGGKARKSTRSSMLMPRSSFARRGSSVVRRGSSVIRRSHLRRPGASLRIGLDGEEDPGISAAVTKRLTTSAQEAVVRRSVNDQAVHKLIVTGWRSSSEVAEQARLQRSSISGLMSEAGLSWKQASLVILFSQTLPRQAKPKAERKASGGDGDDGTEKSATDPWLEAKVTFEPWPGFSDAWTRARPGAMTPPELRSQRQLEQLAALVSGSSSVVRRGRGVWGTTGFETTARATPLALRICVLPGRLARPASRDFKGCGIQAVHGG